jgi:nucleotide-binding universal stress UspA family protein
MPLLGFGALSDRSVVLAEGRRIVDAATARAHTVDASLVVTSRCYDGFASPALINSSGPGTSVVVVGVDGSPSSLRALDAARAEAAIRGAPLHAVRVWEASGPDDPTLADDAAWEDFGRAFEGTVRAAANAGVETSAHVVRSDPVGTLIDHSDAACLLVVGARGAGGFPGLRIGSTAMRLIGHTRCPLLITR